VDGKEKIALADLALSLEGTLACDHVDFAELSEGEAVGLLYRQLQLAGREPWVKLLQILLSKCSAGVREMDDAVKASRSAQDCRVEDRGFVRRRHDNDPLASAHAVEVIEELLQADPALCLAGLRKRAIKVFEEDHGWPVLDGEFEEAVEIAVVDLGIKKSRGVGGQTPARHHGADSRGFPTPGRSVQKVAASEWQLVCTEPCFTLEEGFEVIFEKGPNLVVEDKIIPLAADDATIAAADDVKAWFVVAAI
jgi:hypothetical protein